MRCLSFSWAVGGIVASAQAIKPPEICEISRNGLAVEDTGDGLTTTYCELMHRARLHEPRRHHLLDVHQDRQGTQGLSRGGVRAASFESALNLLFPSVLSNLTCQFITRL